MSAVAQTDKVTFNPSRQGVVHSPWRRGVVLNASRGGRDAADLPAVVNRIPADSRRLDDWYDGYWPVTRTRRWVREDVLADERDAARLALPAPVPVKPVVPPHSLAYRLGHSWGEDLLRGLVAWEQLVRYLGDHLTGAAPLYQSEFQRGFLAAYGTGGPAIWSRALSEATPKVKGGTVTVFSEYGTVTVR